jgi:DNA-binding NarL/FixJ family response regulator
VSVRVLVADDQAVVRAGFRMILEAEPDLEVVAEAADGNEAIALAGRCRPDVALVDVRMPGLDGIAATRQLTAPPARIPVIVITTFDVDDHVFGAFAAGAAGFLLKDVAPTDLVAAVRSVTRGEGVIAPRATRRVIEAFVRSHVPDRPDPRLRTLTEREGEVLRAVAAGDSNADIARRLHLSEATVKKHVSHLLSKLDLRSRAQAVVFAYESGVVRSGAS